jgi:hypothetical protein
MANALKVAGKPEASVVAEIVSAEIENQIATAKQYPRDVAACLDQLERLACRSDAVAESCMYTLKRKDKGGQVNYITGPSVRFAELLAHCWGNLRAGARIIEEGDKAVVAQGIAYDLERNTGFSVEVRRGIVTSTGNRFGSDMINVTSNAACSIALRNAVFDCVPQSLWSDVYEAVKHKAIGAAAIPERLQKAVQFFVAKGATQEDILKAMGVRAIADMGRDHLEIFLGLTTALKEGSIDAAKIFTEEGAEQRRSLSLVADEDGDPNSYNSIDKQLQPKDAAPAKAAAAGAKAGKKGGATKDAAAKAGDSSLGGESQQPATDPGDAGSAATAGDPKTAGGGTQMPGGEAKLSGEPGDAQPQDGASGAGESSAKESDAEVLTRVETAVAATRTGKREIIVAARADLERIRDNASEVALTRRAFALLNKFDLDA